MSNQASTDHPHKTPLKRSSHAHWRTNLRLMVVLLSIWFAVFYLLGIVFVEPLNQFHFGGFPLRFWFAQQGAIFVFIILTFVYAFVMDRIDRRHCVGNRLPSGPSHVSSETAERVFRVWTYWLVGITFPVCIGIAIWSRVGSGLRVLCRGAGNSSIRQWHGAELHCGHYRQSFHPLHLQEMLRI